MSYRTWTDYGFGFCVSDIATTPEKILALAALNSEVYESVRFYLNDCFEGEKYEDEELEVSIFDEYENGNGQSGLAAIMVEVISEIPVFWADDFEGYQFLLYAPKYPWAMEEDEVGLTRERVVEVFTKYIRMLTDVEIPIGYQEVANGG